MSRKEKKLLGSSSDNNIKLCKILSVWTDSKKREDYNFNVISIDLAIEDANGKIKLLTGEFAGDDLPLITDVTENDDYCIWPEDLNDIKRIIPSNNLDDIREELESLLIDQVFIKHSDDPMIYPMGEKETMELDKAVGYSSEQEALASKSKKNGSKTENNSNMISLGSVIKDIKKSVIAQDEPIRKMVTAIYSNQKIFDSNLTKEQKFQAKKNILVVGQTGTGKTEIIRQLTKLLQLPYIVVDANDYTISGYKGKDVDSILLNLLNKTSNNYNAAKRGVIVIDEIDKLGTTKEVSSIATDGVQKGLLKMIEGAIINIESDNGSRDVSFDTSELTFVCAGAFSEIFNKEEQNNKQIGFTKNDNVVKNKIITQQDLIKYGLIPEFVGRIPVIVQMNNLETEDHKNIILNSDLSILKIMMEYYKSIGVTLTYDDDFVDAVAKKVVALKSGARGIKTVLTEIFDEIETEVLNNDLKEVKLTKDNIVRVRKINEQSDNNQSNIN